MPIVGIDLGSSATVMATVGRGGVSVIRNQVSERLTPTLVAFTEKERVIGDDVACSLKSKHSFTCRGFKNILGATEIESQPILSIETQHSLTPIVFNSEVNGLAAYQMPDGRQMTATETLAVFLAKMRAVGEQYVNAPLDFSVITVPAWFGQVHRQAVLDACAVAKIGCHRVMSEHAATALDYGLFRSAEFSDTPVAIAFVDVGYAAAKCFVVDFCSNKLNVVSVVEDSSLGGRDIDAALASTMANAFANSNKRPCNIKKPAVALKLDDAAVKTKKILSANRETTVNVECLDGDDDLQMTLSREQFEQICEPLRNRLVALVQKAVAQSGRSLESIQRVEICGGCSRIPWVQDCIQQVFNREVSRTVNSDECVARGAAVQCAMLDSRHRVKDYSVSDRLPSSYLMWMSTTGTLPSNWKDLKSVSPNEIPGLSACQIFKNHGSSVTELKEMLPAWSVYPTSLKTLSFYNQSTTIAFGIVAANASTGTCTSVGHWTIRIPAEVAGKPNAKTRVKIGIDIHGIVSVDANHTYESQTIEKRKEKRKRLMTPEEQASRAHPESSETVPPGTDAPVSETPSSGETSSAPSAATAPAAPMEIEEEIEVERPVTTVTKSQVTTTTVYPPGWLTYPDVQKLIAREVEMQKRDKDAEKQKVLRNDILTFCYQLRSDFDDSNSERSQFVASAVQKDEILKQSNILDEKVEYDTDLSVSDLENIWSQLTAISAPVDDKIAAARKAALEEQKRKEEEAKKLAAEQAKAEAEAKKLAEEKAKAEAAAAADVEMKPVSAQGSEPTIASPSSESDVSMP